MLALLGYAMLDRVAGVDGLTNAAVLCYAVLWWYVRAAAVAVITFTKRLPSTAFTLLDSVQYDMTWSVDARTTHTYIQTRTHIHCLHDQAR